MYYIHLNRNTTSDQCYIHLNKITTSGVFIHLNRNTISGVLHSPEQDHHQWHVTFTWTGTPPVMCYIYLNRNTTSDQYVTFTWTGMPPVMCYIQMNRTITRAVLHPPEQEHHQCCVTLTWTGNTTTAVLHSPEQETLPVLCYSHLNKKHYQHCVTFTWTGNTTSAVLHSPEQKHHQWYSHLELQNTISYNVNAWTLRPPIWDVKSIPCGVESPCICPL